MIPERKALWIQALRSGEYTQTRDFLHRNHCLCSLGVAADVAIEHGADAFWESLEDCDEMELVDHAGDDNLSDCVTASHQCLTRAVRNWYGGETSVPIELWQAVANRNDNGETFKEIADFLEGFQ